MVQLAQPSDPFGEVNEAYSWVGLVPRFAFATKPDKAIGDPALWERAEELIHATLMRTGVEFVTKPKDGTFYAPKIDIYIDDALVASHVYRDTPDFDDQMIAGKATFAYDARGNFVTSEDEDARWLVGESVSRPAGRGGCGRCSAARIRRSGRAPRVGHSARRCCASRGNRVRRDGRPRYRTSSARLPV